MTQPPTPSPEPTPTPQSAYIATVDDSSGWPVVTITRTLDGKQQSIQLDDDAFI